MTTRLTVRDVCASDWPLVERLFGENGACGGCWCMHWRMERGADWEREKGARNRRALRRLVQAGSVHAVLALDGDEPVGWCCLGPREEFPRLQRSRVLRFESPPGTWAVVCFYIPARWRGRGVGRALLAGALAHARAAGAAALEGYPVQDRNDPTRRYPATFAFTGVPRLFERVGFRDVTPAGSQRLVYRRGFRRARKGTAR
jgi:GNAT superfamily N-acetyltransferase